MKPLIAVRTGVLVAALAVAWLGAGTVTARAQIITLDVSGSLSPVAVTGASCSPSPCTLGGDIVINNVTGAIISEDVTFAGESPVVGPFTQNPVLVPNGSLTLFYIYDSESPTPADVELTISTATAGSVVGYTGGPLGFSAIAGPPPAQPIWELTTGSLTATPEPASALLLASGLAGVCGLLRKRLLHN